jgi:FkbM family methyltransferase
MIFDAGAHDGESIPHWIKLGYGKVVAIEPQLKYCHRIEDKFPDAIVVNAALWSSDGVTDLYECGYSTLPTIVKDKTTMGRFSGCKWKKSKVINTVTLDSLIDDHGVPNKIKMDIEGAEMQALTALSHSVDQVCFEYTVEFIENAIECVKILSRLDEYTFIIRGGESRTIGLHLSEGDAIDMLETFPSKSKTLWGMIDANRRNE